ncbi:hypothetical protein HJC99_06390 [Candidatus Saccharibacteria bacterium]|nr:hypothetical protein [Candidatus Saccharibacteria bacterium]
MSPVDEARSGPVLSIAIQAPQMSPNYAGNLDPFNGNQPQNIASEINGFFTASQLTQGSTAVMLILQNYDGCTSWLLPCKLSLATS